MDAKLIVKKTIADNDLIPAGSKVLLGLSGGPDSLTLLHVLKDLESTFSFELSALHVNHQIRGKEADDDEAFLIDHCNEIGVPLKVVSLDIPKMAFDQNLTIEEAGRIARHDALFGEAKFMAEGTLVALAHNRDDQAETVLMRILRGSGVHGLAAMDYKRSDGLIRPLLDVTRAEVLAYCKDNNLTPRMDSTNLRPDYTRNKIRLQLLPLLEKEYNPNIKEALVRLSKAAYEDDSFIESLAKESDLSVKKLAKLDKAVFKRVVVNEFANIGLSEDITSVHINALRAAVLKNVGGKTIEFPHGYKAIIQNGMVKITK